MKFKRLTPALFLFLGLLASQVHAQDFTMSPWETTDPATAPDKLPSVRDLELPPVPAALKNYQGYAFAQLTMAVVEDNKLSSWEVTTTHPYLDNDLFLPPAKLVTAKRQGKPVAAAVRAMVIFNPSSAPINGDTAKPRLIKAMPLYYNFDADLSHFLVRLQINPEGKVVKADMPTALPSTFHKAVHTVVEKWQFLPAREHGQPVPATIEVPVFLRGAFPTVTAQYKSPVPVHQEPPVYPLSMKMSGFEGKVVLEFGVDPTGRVRRPFVQSSNNPGFDAAALESIRQWTFKPATVDGTPVATKRVQLPIQFQIDGIGASAFRVKYSKSNLAKLPPELQYDVPPELTNIMPVVYPYEALLEKARGEVEVSFIVGPEGRVIQNKIWAAARPDFAEAVKASLNTLRFKPALKNGEPSMAALRMKFKFHESMGDVSLDSGARDLLKELRAEKLQPVAANELDGKLRPVSQRPPFFPSGVEVNSGRAVIEFLIDESGLARLPRTIEASAPEFGYAACQTIATWRFEPPTKNGEAVITRVRVPVNFERK